MTHGAKVLGTVEYKDAVPSTHCPHCGIDVTVQGNPEKSGAPIYIGGCRHLVGISRVGGHWTAGFVEDEGGSRW